MKAHIWIFLLAINSTVFAGTPLMDKYLTKCGGKIYSTCNSPDLNQETIYNEGRSNAQKENKNIMVIIGADWCPACMNFSKMLANDPDRKKIHDQLTILELNGDLSSTKELAKKLKIGYVGYPQAFIIKPATNERIQQLYPLSESSNFILLTTVRSLISSK